MRLAKVVDYVLQQRSHHKDLEPGLWTVSCSGHVDRGEDYLTASVREFSEELGVSIQASELDNIFYSAPTRETGYEFITSYKLSRPVHPIPCETEVLGVREVQLADLKTWMQKEPQQFSSSFRFLIPHIWGGLHKFITSGRVALIWDPGPEPVL